MSGTFIDDIEILFIFEYLNHFRKHFAALTELHIFILKDLIPGQFILEPFKKHRLTCLATGSGVN